MLLTEEMCMSVSSVESGYQLIQRSQTLANEAAGEIADASKSNDLEFNKIASTEPEPDTNMPTVPAEESLLKLQKAKTYNQVGANLVQRSNDIIGTILDTHV